MKKIVYNIKTGEPVEVDGVDAKEYVGTKGWSYDKPDEKIDEPEQPEQKSSSNTKSRKGK